MNAPANALIEHREPSNAITPMDMLDRALASGASVEVLDKLLTLRERWEASQARKLFDTAIAAAKADLPIIVKQSKGHNDKSYANFATIAKAIDPILSQHGLSYRFRSQQTDRIVVTCVLSHEAGHFEETSLAGPADTTGNKNAIQAIGSTLTYLQRYTLVQALGLAAAEDDDGKASGNGGPISSEQAETLRTLIEETRTDIQKFCEFAKIEAVTDLPASAYQRAVDSLLAKKRKLAS